MLAEAQAVGDAGEEGWRPQRTIVYAAWDGEEEGLLGSTEWVETHAEELSRKAVAYINTDGNGRGFLDAGGSHALEQLVNEVARRRDRSGDGRQRAAARAQCASRSRQRTRRRAQGDARARRSRHRRARLRLRLHAVPPAPRHRRRSNIGFGGEDGGGSYHSIYDSIRSLRALQRSRVRVRPWRSAQDRRPAGAAAGERRRAAVRVAASAGRHDRRLREGVDETGRDRAREIERAEPAAPRTDRQLAADPTKPLRAAAHGGARAVPESGAAAECRRAAARRRADTFDAAVADPKNASRLASAETAARLDAALRGIDQAFSSDAGLPRRPWFGTRSTRPASTPATA